MVPGRSMHGSHDRPFPPSSFMFFRRRGTSQTLYVQGVQHSTRSPCTTNTTRPFRTSLITVVVSSMSYCGKRSSWLLHTTLAVIHTIVIASRARKKRRGTIFSINYKPRVSTFLDTCVYAGGMYDKKPGPIRDRESPRYITFSCVGCA